MSHTPRLKERLQQRAPLALKILAKRALVGTVGACVGGAARLFGFGEYVLHLAVKHGLDLDRAWPTRPRAVPDIALKDELWSAQDFLFLMDGAQATANTADRAISTSIIIPVFNKVEYTFQALRALLREVDLAANEIIIVNNASRDETPRLLAHFGALLKVVNNEENLGFVDACNQGAAIARGRYLIFLNNDTFVLPGWWRALVATVEGDERVGAVGSLFLYPDHTIQEAGAIIWRDGVPHHCGWGRRGDDRSFNFAREVDYCSGASLLIRKELFEQVGGFDRRFAPAYYEDADLCMSVRALGHKVVFQPASRLIHYEGATAGRDTGTGLKRYQVVNHEKFVAKWQAVLAREHWPNDPANIARANDRRRGPRVIIFDERVPTPDRDAGSARMLFILRTLARSCRVMFVPMNRPEWPEYEKRLWQEGIETTSVAAVARLLRARRFAAAVVSRPPVAAAFMPRLRRAGVRLIFDMVDAHFLRFAREHAVTNDPQIATQAAHYRKLETRLARMSDLIWCNSAEDKRAVAEVAPGAPIEVIPTIHELHERGLPFDERRQLLFIGNLAHRPNSDGVRYFMREVFPLIKQALPDIELDIIGDNPAEIGAYADASVRVHGYVPDVTTFWQTRRVFVAPLRYGAGVKGKIGEALAHGLPCVTTSVGAEGMGLIHEDSAMITDTAAAFAAAVVALYRERELWQRLADNGYAHIGRHFTPAVCAPVITDSLRALLADNVFAPRSVAPVID
ncbi:MAG TPA: glycosyltransferase [Pyrinomonadaceae bacterium]|jgi:GT2 family glycosyltransferase